MAWPLHSAVFEAVDFGGEARSAVQFGLSVDVDVVVRDCSSLIALLRNKLASVVLTATFYQIMEQQTVTIAKAGIHASLNAHCGVDAAANPVYGTYNRSLTPTKNIGLPDSLFSRFDLVFIVLDQMDPDVDRRISEHVLHMHCFRCSGMVVADNNSRQAEEDDAELATSIFVKYNGLLHGERKTRHSKNEKLTVKFLKKYIHYSKSRHQPVLTDKASEHIASTYAEMRNAGAEAKFGGATLPIIARSLETVIRLSTTHAKVKLRNQSLAQRLPGTLYELVGPQPYNVRLHAGVNSKNLPVSSLWPNYIHPYVQRKETLPILS